MRNTVWKEEFIRCFFNWRFHCAVIFTAMLYLLIAEAGIPAEGMDGLYYYRLVTGHDMLIISFSFCAWVYGGSYCEEHKFGYDIFVLLRASLRQMVIARIFVCICSGIMVKMMGAWTFLLVLRVRKPWLDPLGISKREFSGEYWGLADLVRGNHMVLYFLLDTFLAGCLAGLLVAAAYYFSLYLQEKTVILVFPVLFYYFIIYYGVALLKLPDWLQINKIFDISYDVLQNSFLSYLYALGWFLILAILLCIISYRKCKRIFYE